MSKTTINESLTFSQLWLGINFLAYSVFVILSIVTLLGVSQEGPAVLDTTALWTFLYGPVLATFAGLDARRINAAVDLNYDVRIVNSWVWTGTVLAFPVVAFWLYIAHRRQVVSTYPELIEIAEQQKQRGDFGYSEKVSSLWYSVALIVYFVGFYVSLFCLLGGYSITYVLLPWFFAYGPIIGICVLFDAWKVNSSSDDKRLNQTFWPLFAWFFFFTGFWFYFLERRRAVGAYNVNEPRGNSGVERWANGVYDLIKVKLHRVLFKILGVGVQDSANRGSSKQRSSDRPKRPSLDSQIVWALGVFGLDANASKVLVRKRYRELISDYHPDKLGQATEAQRRLVEDKAKEINRAHDLLERYFVGGTKNEVPTLIQEVTQAIEEFSPSTIWNNEAGYQAELYSVLKQRFPEASVDPQKDSSRPDLLIQDIGVEVKGPTDAAELKSLSDECLRYSPHYKNMIFVLFKPEFTELLYKEVTNGISRTYPNVKIIRKA